jgi:hypothetical protein
MGMCLCLKGMWTLSSFIRRVTRLYSVCPELTLLALNVCSFK